MFWILLAAVPDQGLTRLAAGLSCTRDQHCFVAPLLNSTFARVTKSAFATEVVALSGQHSLYFAPVD